MSDCKPDKEYLDDSSPNKTDHTCKTCMDGADCSKPTTFSSLRPLPGYRGYSWASNESLFAKCPYPEACVNGACDTEAGYEGDDSIAPLCGVCREGFAMESSGCVKCTNEYVGTKIAIAGVCAVLITCIYVVILRRRVRKLFRHYVALWRDAVMLVKVVITFGQVAGSMPQLYTVRLPTLYLAWLDSLDFLQLNFMSMLGVTCVPGGSSYELRFIMPVSCLSLLFFACTCRYFVRKRLLKKRFTSNVDVANMRRAAGHIFSMMDSDLSGTLDEKELSVVIKQLSPDAKTPESSLREARLLAEKYGTRNQSTDGSGEIYEVDSKGFLNALSDSGTLDTSNTKALNWILQVEQDQLKSSFKTIIINVLLLFHAPISKVCMLMSFLSRQGVLC